jgi:serine/threonine-protein kinase HipA
VHDERAVTKAEVLALRLARRAGIRAAEARIVMSDEVPVVIPAKAGIHVQAM